MNRTIHRGETKLIRIKASDIDSPVTDIADIVFTITQGQTVTKLSLSDFTYVSEPEAMYQYRISQEMSLSWEETCRRGKYLRMNMIWILHNGMRKESSDKVFEILPTKHNEVMT